MPRLMKYLNINTEIYAAPSLSIVEVAVEMGFEASLPGVGVAPWEEEEGGLEL